MLPRGLAQVSSICGQAVTFLATRSPMPFAHSKKNAHIELSTL